MISKNGVALAIIIGEAILSSLGVEFEPGSLEKIAEGVVVTIGLILAVVNQVDRSDVHNFFFKR